MKVKTFTGTGKPVNRRVAVIAISVWYEEPAETG
jgi:hypothetical protein